MEDSQDSLGSSGGGSSRRRSRSRQHRIVNFVNHERHERVVADLRARMAALQAENERLKELMRVTVAELRRVSVELRSLTQHSPDEETQQETGETWESQQRWDPYDPAEEPTLSQTYE